MATKTFEELKQLAIQIRDEKTNKQNTATRIGTQMLEHLDKLEQDYYDKTTTNEELQARDEKLTELGNQINYPSFYYEKILQGVGTISNYYFNKSGHFVQQNGQECKYCKVNKGDCIRVTGGTNVAVYAAWGFFEKEPTIESRPYMYVPYTNVSDQYIIVPKDGYILGSADVNTGVLIYIGIKSLQEKIYDIERVKGIYSYKNIEEVKIYDNYYIDKFGNFVSQSLQKVKCWHVNKGDILKVDASFNVNYSAWAIYEELPNELSKPLLYAPYEDNTDLYLISPIDGYIASSAYNGNVRLLKTELSDIDAGWIKDRDLLLSCDYESQFLNIETINGYYFNKSGGFTPQGGQECKYCAVSKGDCIRVIGGTNVAAYAAWGFFEEKPTINSTPYLFAPYTNVSDQYVIAPKDGYILGSADVNVGVFLYEGSSRSSKKPYNGKYVLYIGDSISSSNDYRWKGLLETNYNLRYARDLAEQLAPASPGIPLMPQDEDDSLPLKSKSMWYRCAQKRMSIYSFDMISLFGGTNDMTIVSLKIGTVDDVAYVDNTEGITDLDENCTSEKPAELSFASALKGCVLMLKRDFPGKEIVIPTVMPCGGIYGNWTDKDTGLKASEAIANLQLRIAEKYGLKAIPLYWDMRKVENAAYNWADQWGVHPNYQGALRLQALFAQTLCL